MQQYIISTKKNYDQLKDKLLSDVVFKNDYILQYSYQSDQKKAAVDKLSTAIFEVIQQQILEDFANKYLQKRRDLSKEVRQDIYEAFTKSNYLLVDEGISCVSYYLLYVPILEYLLKNDYIDLDGWINFRTLKYCIILEDIIVQTIYDYEMHSEYIKYMEFLKHITDSKNSLEETLNIYCSSTGSLEIYDNKQKNVTTKYIEKYCQEIDFADMTPEDLIVTILIGVCPEETIIHNHAKYDNENFLQTLGQIFNITLCTGCDICDIKNEQ
ncbi:MAG: hypothetical protein BEN19_05310 [Epulopiscium sp. Nuni2H_MBin003]|nr:MAG: hypothetical protein BEN19_05310 [Epulopiscium sp. Nuni2H_MBin003]